jgi:hypothetical protein
MAGDPKPVQGMRLAVSITPEENPTNTHVMFLTVGREVATEKNHQLFKAYDEAYSVGPSCISGNRTLTTSIYPIFNPNHMPTFWNRRKGPMPRFAAVAEIILGDSLPLELIQIMLGYVKIESTVPFLMWLKYHPTTGIAIRGNSHSNDVFSTYDEKKTYCNHVYFED